MAQSFSLFAVSTSTTTTEANPSVCAADCIAGILLAAAGRSIAIEHYTVDAIIYIILYFFSYDNVSRCGSWHCSDNVEEEMWSMDV